MNDARMLRILAGHALELGTDTADATAVEAQLMAFVIKPPRWVARDPTRGWRLLDLPEVPIDENDEIDGSEGPCRRQGSKEEKQAMTAQEARTLPDESVQMNDDWCSYCGCGNDRLGYAHLAACKAADQGDRNCAVGPQIREPDPDRKHDAERNGDVPDRIERLTWE